MPRPGQLLVDGDDEQLGGAVYVERVVVQCEDGHGGGDGGEVKLHHDRLLAVDSNLVYGGPGEEVVGGTLEERVVRAGIVNDSSYGQLIHVFPTTKGVQECAVNHAEEAQGAQVHSSDLGDSTRMLKDWAHDLAHTWPVWMCGSVCGFVCLCVYTYFDSLSFGFTMSFLIAFPLDYVPGSKYQLGLLSRRSPSP